MHYLYCHNCLCLRRRIRKGKRAQHQQISTSNDDNEAEETEEESASVMINAAFEANEDDQASAVGVENINVDIASLYAKPMKHN